MFKGIILRSERYPRKFDEKSNLNIHILLFDQLKFGAVHPAWFEIKDMIFQVDQFICAHRTGNSIC